MKFKFLSALLLALVALPVCAQDENPQTIAFDNISFSYDASIASRVVVEEFTPEQDDPHYVAPGTHFLFYDTVSSDPPPREWRPDTRTDAAGIIRISKLEDFGNEQRGGVISLLELLEQRPDLTSQREVSETRLPFLPEVVAYQDIRAQVQYLDLAGISGIRYITAFGGRTSPFRGDDSLLYTFQGITADHNYYVSVIFVLSTDLFPDELPPDFDEAAFVAGIDDYLAESTARINAASPDQFSPSLSSLDTIIRSLVIAGSTDVVPTPEPTHTAALEPLWSEELIGTTWTLQSFTVVYDSPNNPHAVESDAAPFVTVTMTFAAEGLRGIAGCNPFTATFRRENGRLVLNHLNITHMTCDEITMEQESLFLDSLQMESALGWSYGEDYIVIRGNRGLLSFVRAS